MQELTNIITETVPIFFFVYNLKKGKVDFVSPQFFELLKENEGAGGSHEENALAKCIASEHQPKLNEFLNSLSRGNHYQGAIELKASSSLEEVEWVEINTFPVMEGDQSVLNSMVEEREEVGYEVERVVGHIVDISQKKEQYEILNREKKHISNMLNMLAHDMRAPFNRVHMIAEVLEGMMTEEELDKYYDYLQMLRKQGEESKVLLESLLNLATLKGKASSLDMNIEDAGGLIRESIDRQKSKIEQKKITVHCDFPEEKVIAKLDAVLFLQVLGNLLSNALKFTPEGGEVTFRLWKTRKNVFMVIKDTGIGIPEEYQENLFQDFLKFRRKGLGGEPSVGLGLFICREILAMHQGSISVESKEREGTSFTIKLPAPEMSAAYF